MDKHSEWVNIENGYPEENSSVVCILRSYDNIGFPSHRLSLLHYWKEGHFSGDIDVNGEFIIAGCQYLHTR